MDLVLIAITIALLEYLYFGILVGKARGKTGIKAPAVSGDPEFERYYRVHQNTMELLVAFVPSIVIFAMVWRADVAAALGAVYIIGRYIYMKSYVSDPAKRTIGFALSFLPILILIVGGLIGAIMRIA